MWFLSCWYPATLSCDFSSSREDSGSREFRPLFIAQTEMTNLQLSWKCVPEESLCDLVTKTMHNSRSKTCHFYQLCVPRTDVAQSFQSLSDLWPLATQTLEDSSGQSVLGIFSFQEILAVRHARTSATGVLGGGKSDRQEGSVGRDRKMTCRMSFQDGQLYVESLLPRLSFLADK